MQIFFKKPSIKTLVLLFCTVVTLSLSSCKDDEPEPVKEREPVAFFSLYQASPNAPDMDIYVGDQLATTTLFKYTTFFSYSAFPPNSYRFRFNPVNAATSYIDSTLVLADSTVHSLFTVGNFPDIELLVVEDSVKTPATGKAGLRVIHLSPDAPVVNFVSTGTTGQTLFSDVEFKEDTDFIEIDAGSRSFQVKQAGTEDVLLSLTNQTFQSGRVYTILIRGFKTPPSGNTNTLSLQVITNL